MKILVLTRGIPNKKNPQLGCFEMDQALALKSKGHDVTIMCINGFVGKYWKKLGFSSSVHNGIKCYEFFGIPSAAIRKYINSKLGIWIENIVAPYFYKRVIKEIGVPDIVHAHYLNVICHGAAIKKKYNINLVGTEHWSELSHDNLKPKVITRGNFAYPVVDKLICVSERLQKNIFHHFKKESCVIHNLIDTTHLLSALSQTNNSTYTILAVGSLFNVKGFDILIKSFAASKLINENVVLKILGKGIEYENLSQLITTLQLEKKVLLCGQKNKKEVFDELHKADLFVLSSRRENFSVALIEATANGVPAIATLCGGVYEYPVRDVIKIPVEDIDAMKNALENSYDNRNEIDRTAIQKETLNYFSPEVIVEQIEKVYAELLKQ